MYSWSLVGHVSLNFMENLSDDTLWILSIIYRLPHGEYCRHFSDIFSGLSWWIISPLCRAFHCDCSPHIVGRLTMNYLDIFSELSLWIFSVSWHASLLNCPRNFPGYSLWMYSNYFGSATASYPDKLWSVLGQFSGYFVCSSHCVLYEYLVESCDLYYTNTSFTGNLCDPHCGHLYCTV